MSNLFLILAGMCFVIAGTARRHYQIATMWSMIATAAIALLCWYVTK